MLTVICLSLVLVFLFSLLVSKHESDCKTINKSAFLEL